MLKKAFGYVKRNHLVMYAFLGIVTTAVNYLVYFPLFNICGVSAAVSNMIAWIASVIVAFVTNKPLVFESKDWSGKVLFPELARFAGCRLASGLIETLFIHVTVDILLFSGNYMKVLISVVVVILNYAASKLLVFQKDPS